MQVTSVTLIERIARPNSILLLLPSPPVASPLISSTPEMLTKVVIKTENSREFNQASLKGAKTTWLKVKTVNSSSSRAACAGSGSKGVNTTRATAASSCSCLAASQYHSSGLHASGLCRTCEQAIEAWCNVSHRLYIRMAVVMQLTELSNTSIAKLYIFYILLLG
jgi:hypothetical protein